MFKSWDYDQTTWAPETASLSVSAGNIFKFQPPGLAGKTCMVVAKEKKVYRSNPDPSSFLVLDGFGKFFVKMTGIGTVYLSVACWSDPRQLDLLPVKFAITGTP